MYQMLCVGEIVNTHGINGELKVIPLTDDISLFDDLKSFTVDDKIFNLESKRIHKNMLLIKVEGINDINDAERLKGKFLEVDRNELKSLKENQYYICDMIGLKIIDENLGEIGIINDIQETGSNDIYITKYMDKPLCIPALADVILEVNINDGYIKVNLPKGLI